MRYLFYFIISVQICENPHALIKKTICVLDNCVCNVGHVFQLLGCPSTCLDDLAQNWSQSMDTGGRNQFQIMILGCVP